MNFINRLLPLTIHIRYWLQFFVNVLFFLEIAAPGGAFPVEEF
jgi:hypothetical protein